MNDLQRAKIPLLRHQGHSYASIAKALNISENTIKSFCRRNNLGSAPKYNTTDKEICTICKQCGEPLTQSKKGTRSKFCCEQCRRTWWRINKEQGNKKAYYLITCEHCGKEFESYGNSGRKFCGHSCYISHRFKGGCTDVEGTVYGREKISGVNSSCPTDA